MGNFQKKFDTLPVFENNYEILQNFSINVFYIIHVNFYFTIHILIRIKCGNFI